MKQQAQNQLNILVYLSGFAYVAEVKGVNKRFSGMSIQELAQHLCKILQDRHNYTFVFNECPVNNKKGVYELLSQEERFEFLRRI